MTTKILMNMEQYNNILAQFTKKAFNHFGNRLSDKNYSENYRKQNLNFWFYNRFHEHPEKLNHDDFKFMLEDLFKITSTTITHDIKEPLSKEQLLVEKEALMKQMQVKFGQKLEIFDNLHPDFIDDEEIMILAMTKHCLAYRCASDRLRSDLKFTSYCIGVYGNSLQYANDPLKDNKDLVLLSLKEKGFLAGNNIQYASDRLKDDFDIAALAVSKYGSSLEYVSDKLKDNEEIVNIAINQTGVALVHASPRLQNDRNMVLQAVTNCGWVLEHLNAHYKDDKEIVMLACASKNLTLKHASKRLQDDKEVVLVAIEKDHESFQHCSYRLRNDREVILKAVEKHGRMIIYSNLKSSFDRDIGLAAVKSYPPAIEYLSISLRRDKEIAKIAVKGGQFQKIGERLKCNKNYILELINERQNVFAYLPNILKQDKDIIFAAVKLDQRILNTLPLSWQNNKELALWALENFPHPHYDESEEERNEELLKLLNADLQKEIGNNNPISYLKSFILKQSIEKTIAEQKIDIPITKKKLKI